MKTFVIDADNNVTVFVTAAEAKKLASGDRFASVEDLASLSATWPASRLVEIWNSISGLPPVKKFMDRKTAVRRVWCAVQQLEPVPLSEERNVSVDTPHARSAQATRAGSKKDVILGLLKRMEGATLKDLMLATDWQAHSIRGFISGTLVKKLSLKVDSVKKDGHRVYSITD